MRKMTKRPGWTASMVLAAAVVAGSLPGVDLMRQNLKRRHPELDDEGIAP